MPTLSTHPVSNIVHSLKNILTQIAQGLQKYTFVQIHVHLHVHFYAYPFMYMHVYLHHLEQQHKQENILLLEEAFCKLRDKQFSSGSMIEDLLGNIFTGKHS